MHSVQTKILEILKKRGGAMEDFSFRTLGSLLGVDHPQQVKHHLSQLEKRGLVFVDSTARVLRLAAIGGTHGSALVTVPIIGAANCGQPTLFAEQNFEGTLRISKRLIGNRDKNIFAIRAAGSSMNRANINGLTVDDGDYVVVDGNPFNPRNGDYVLAIVDDFGVVKKFKRSTGGDDIELASESTEEHPPIHIHPDDQQLIINGKVVYVIKKPKTSRPN